MIQTKIYMQLDKISWRVSLGMRASLGEGLHWDAERQCLWFVDIHGHQVLRWRLDEPHAQSWSLPQRVGWILPETGRDSVLLGLQDGVVRTVLDESTISPNLVWLVKPFEERPSMRLNDAKRDATGRIWLGSLNNDDESRPDGSLFYLDSDSAFIEVDSGYTVANGPALAPNGRLMLHTDSGRRTVFAFDLDLKTGRLSGKRVWKIFEDSEGYPDGMCFDAQGCVWIAHWGAGCISRFNSEGALLHRVSLPARQITNVCFAGPQLDRIFVSSAAVGLSFEQDAFAGHLFEVFDTQGAFGF